MTAIISANHTAQLVEGWNLGDVVIGTLTRAQIGPLPSFLFQHMHCDGGGLVGERAQANRLDRIEGRTFRSEFRYGKDLYIIVSNRETKRTHVSVMPFGAREEDDAPTGAQHPGWDLAQTVMARVMNPRGSATEVATAESTGAAFAPNEVAAAPKQPSWKKLLPAAVGGLVFSALSALFIRLYLSEPMPMAPKALAYVGAMALSAVIAAMSSMTLGGHLLRRKD